MLRLCLTACLVSLLAGSGAAAANDAAHGCLPSGNGYLHARIRGALNLDIDWDNAEIECDGGPRLALHCPQCRGIAPA